MWNDHCIGEQVLIPAASHITFLGGASLIKHKGASGIEILDIIIPRPLVVNETKMSIQCIVEEGKWYIQGEVDGVRQQYANCRVVTPLFERNFLTFTQRL